MVAISASVCTKTGRVLVSRQFVELPKSRIQGLLAAFHKQVNAQDKQHTYFEHQSVRYVYQPMEDLYVVLITNKSSNIVEDLETLQLITNIVSEYCGTLSENAVYKKAFDLIFAFDEVIALGYREKVTLSQVKTLLEMDSQEEKNYQIAQRNKERLAEEEARRKRKEIERERKQKERFGMESYSTGGGYMPRGSSISSSSSRRYDYGPVIEKPISKPSPKSGMSSRKGLSLKPTAPKANDLMEVLQQEGNLNLDIQEPEYESSEVPSTLRDDVHFEITEAMVASMDKDGSLRQLEVRGELNLLLKNDTYKALDFNLAKPRDDITFKMHPAIDKNKFSDNNTVSLKDPKRGYSTSAPNNILKWRIVSNDTLDLPLVITCWPSAGVDNIVTVSLEYEYKADLGFDLYDVVVKIPVVSQSDPNISNVDGDTRFNTKDSVLEWHIGRIDKSNTNGNLEFEIQQYNSDLSHLYPVTVIFKAEGSLCGVKIDSASIEGQEVPYSIYSNFEVRKYEIM